MGSNYLLYTSSLQYAAIEYLNAFYKQKYYENIHHYYKYHLPVHPPSPGPTFHRHTNRLHKRPGRIYGDIALPDDAQTHINSYHVSVLMGYKLGKYIQIGLEPGYVRRGAACEPGALFSVPGNVNFQGDSKLFAGYLETPLVISGHLPLFQGKLELICKGGYGPALLVSAMREFTDSDTDYRLY